MSIKSVNKCKLNEPKGVLKERLINICKKTKKTYAEQNIIKNKKMNKYFPS